MAAGVREATTQFSAAVPTDMESAMTLGIVPNGIKVEMNALQNGIPVVNRFYVTMSSAPSSGDLDDVIVATLAFFNDLKATLHTSYVLQNITATDVHVANGTQTILPLVTDNTGANGGVAAAANAAMCVSLRTNFTGRSFRGRFYVGGFPAAALVDAQNFNPDTSALVAGVFEDFIDALNTINMVLVVVSNFAAGVERVVALATEIINVIVDTKVDSQRRRTAN